MPQCLAMSLRIQSERRKKLTMRDKRCVSIGLRQAVVPHTPTLNNLIMGTSSCPYWVGNLTTLRSNFAGMVSCFQPCKLSMLRIIFQHSALKSISSKVSQSCLACSIIGVYDWPFIFHLLSTFIAPFLSSSTSSPTFFPAVFIDIYCPFVHRLLHQPFSQRSSSTSTASWFVDSFANLLVSGTHWHLSPMSSSAFIDLSSSSGS